MERKEFRKITSRILRHGGFITQSNKITHEYEMKLATENEPILFCKMVNIAEDGESLENYLCFRATRALTAEEEKLYNRIIKRFTKLAPSVNISFENETEPVFTDEQLEIIDSLLKEHSIKEIQNEN